MHVKQLLVLNIQMMGIPNFEIAFLHTRLIYLMSAKHLIMR